MPIVQNDETNEMVSIKFVISLLKPTDFVQKQV